MKAFVAILLVVFATGVGLLTYIAAGGRISDLVGEEIAAMIPFDLEPNAAKKDASEGLPIPEVTSDSSLDLPIPGSVGASQSATSTQTTRPGQEVQQSQSGTGVGTASQGSQATNASTSAQATTAQSVPEEPEGPFRLSLPLDCEYGRSCFIQYYPDMGISSEVVDYQCGPLSFEGHRGTDFRLPSYRDMERGVSVIAAAPGTVLAVRDGMPDAHFGLFGRDAMKGRALGNTIIIQHQDGYRTYYGHLKRGSIMVEKGTRVARGQPIAQVGMSGLTIIPAVHLHVTKDKQVVDPFSGKVAQTECGVGTADSLWLPAVLSELSYARTLILRIGFTTREMTRAAAEYDLIDYEKLSKRATQLWFNAYVAGVHEGDGYSIRVTDPDGELVFATLDTFPEAAPTKLIKAGQNPLSGPLKPGTYTAVFKYFKRATSEGAEPEAIFDLERQVEVR